jgi:CBS domain-containing protein
MAQTVRDVMASGAESIEENDTILDAARRLAELDIGAMPMCEAGGEISGMLTDRDVVVKVIAQGKDVGEVTAGELAQGPVATVSPDTSLEDAIETMTREGVRRLPVVEGDDLVGMVSQADLARALPQDQAAKVVEAVSASSG